MTHRKLLVYAAAVLLLLCARPDIATFIAGALMVLLGVSLRIWTFGHLRKNQLLVTTGPYAYTRNPAYLGSALILTGLVVAAGNAHSVAGLAIWAGGLVGLDLFFGSYLPRKYRREYGRLSQLFPGPCAQHARHVPDFFPRLTPWRSGDSQRFSWAGVCNNHELIWPPACALALALMWVR